MSEEKKPEYPVAESFKVLEGYDIHRSDKLIIALVVVENSYQDKDLRIYRWQKRSDEWKVDLCRMTVKFWNWDEIAAKARELIEKYKIRNGVSKKV